MGTENVGRAQFGYVRLASVSPELRIADVVFNVDSIRSALIDASGCDIVVFPELCLTGYSCADLFYQTNLRESAEAGLGTVAKATLEHGCAAAVGLPVAIRGRLYNMAAFLCNGRILGLVPKLFLPTTHEFYEQRWFTSGDSLPPGEILFAGQQVPVGMDLIFQAEGMPGLSVGIEICEDLWAVKPPSADLALAGATVLLNPSASNEVLGKAAYRRDLVRQQSGRCLAAYAYASANAGESTTDVVYSGHCIIAENGAVLAETGRFEFGTRSCMADIDMQQLTQERLANSSFSTAKPPGAHRVISFRIPSLSSKPSKGSKLLRPLPQLPFVPSDTAQRSAHCAEIFAIQSTALAKRFRHTWLKTAVIGLSGGLDSTLALLVVCRTFDRLKLPHQGIRAITMPGFGTTSHTRDNAVTLAKCLGVSLQTISIEAAVTRHFEDIGHPIDRYDATYENAQARERTQILMDLANKHNGLVIGTGDLSELALGWCTFNGDHMSMYHVNAGVPKTLVRWLVEWAADNEFSGPATEVLHSICQTPITPELLPLGKDQALQQKTEEIIGPYELHDFFLFFMVRHAFAPRKILWLAEQAFEGKYSRDTLLKWLRTFYKRFFSQQFKRSSMPDGPKVGSVALSPRGDWRMPSDAEARLWLDECV